MSWDESRRHIKGKKRPRRSCFRHHHLCGDGHTEWRQSRTNSRSHQWILAAISGVFIKARKVEKMKIPNIIRKAFLTKLMISFIALLFLCGCDPTIPPEKMKEKIQACERSGFDYRIWYIDPHDASVQSLFYGGYPVNVTCQPWSH